MPETVANSVKRATTCRPTTPGAGVAPLFGGVAPRSSGIWISAFACVFSGAVACFAQQTGPTTSPGEWIEELSTIDYSGFRLLRATLAADGSRVLLNLDHPTSGRSLVRVHDTTTGKKLGEWEPPAGKSVIGGAISRQGSRVILQASSGKLPYQVQVIDVTTSRIEWETPSGPGDTTFADSDGNVVLVCHVPDDAPTGTRELFAVNVKERKELWRKSVDAAPGFLELSSDGKLVLASKYGRGPASQCVVDLTRAQVVATLQGSTLKRLSDRYAFLGDRAEVVGIVDNVLTRWDVVTGKIIDEKKGVPPLGREGYATFSPDGRRLYLRYGIHISALDSMTGAAVGHAMVPPQAQLEAASDRGVIALRMVPLPTLRVIKVGR